MVDRIGKILSVHDFRYRQRSLGQEKPHSHCGYRVFVWSIGYKKDIFAALRMNLNLYKMIYRLRDMIYGLRRMIYLLRKYDIIPVPIIREAYIICEADIIASAISSVTAGNGYH